MASHPYKPRAAGTLKDAVTRLVEACGGLKLAAARARVGRQQLFRYTDDSDDHADIHIPADIVADLEARCGDPIVTGFLAAEAGCALLRLPPAGLPDAWAENLAVVLRETGEAVREIDQAIAAFVAQRQRIAAERDRAGEGAL